METRAHHVLIGAFTFMMLMGIVGFIIWVAQMGGNVETKRYQIFFTDAVTGLSTASPVRFKGITVGSVVEIALDKEDPTRIRVLIDVSTNAPIRRSSLAKLEVQGLTGVSFIQLQTDKADDPPLVKLEGEKYPTIQTGKSSLSALLNEAPGLIDDGRELLQDIKALLSKDNPEGIAEIIKDISVITGAVAAREEDLKKVFEDLAATTDNVKDITGDVKEDYPQLARDLKKTAENVAKITEGLNQMVEESRPGIAQFANQGLPELSLLITDLRTLSASLTLVAQRLESQPASLVFPEKRPEIAAE